MNTFTLVKGFIIGFSLLFLAGCATTRIVPSLDMSNPEIRNAYEKGTKEAKAEKLVIDKCRAKNKGRTDEGVPPGNSCKVNSGYGYSGYYRGGDHSYYNNRSYSHGGVYRSYRYRYGHW